MSQTKLEPKKFPVELFRGCLGNAPKVRKKLQPFITQFNHQNMVYIFNAISELDRIFKNPKEDINIKFSSIFAVKVLFDTCDIGMINLIEAFLLEPIIQIALRKAESDDQQNTTRYFIDIGYPSNIPDIQSFGFAYVRLAAEIVTVSAMVKPRRLFQNQEMKTPSNFAKAYKRYLKAGGKPIAELGYYKGKLPQEMRNKYQVNLQTFKNHCDNYCEYFVKCGEKMISKGFNFDPSIADCRKLFATGDVLITTDVIGLCSEALSSESFLKRRNALILLNEFLKWGDYEAYIVISQDKFIKEIVRHIVNLPVKDLTLARGYQIYPEIKGQEQAKHKFYQEFMKCVETWGLCFEKDIMRPEKHSKIYQLYRIMKGKQKLNFPESTILQRFKEISSAAFEKNKQKTARVFQEYQGNPDVESEIKREQQSQKKQPSNEKSLSSMKLEDTPSGITPYQDMGTSYITVKKAIDNAWKIIIQELPHSEKDVHGRMEYLKKFSQNFEKNIENLDEQSNSKFDEVFEEGLKVVDRISQIQEIYKRYRKGTASFKELSAAALGKQYKPESHVKMPSTTSIKDGSKVKIQSQVKLPSQSQLKAQSKEKIPDQLAQKQEQFKSDFRKNKNDDLTQNNQHKSSSQIQELPEISYISTKNHNQNNSKKSFEHEPISPIQKVREHNQMRSVNVQELGLNINSRQSIQKLDLQEQLSKKSEHKAMKDPSRQSFGQRQSFSSMHSSPKKGVSQSRLPETSSIKEQPFENIEIMPGVMKQSERQNFSFSPTRNSKHDLDSQKKDPFQNQDHHEYQQQSPLNAYENMIEDKLVQNQEWEGDINYDDQIEQPELSPLNDSYHNISELETKIKNDPLPSFKSCFANDQYLLSSTNQSKKLEKLFWLENDTVNLFKPTKGVHSRTVSSRISIPQLLQERGSKYQNQMDFLQQENTKHISLLQGKIKDLEFQGSHLKDKVHAQERQIKVMKDMTQDGGLSRTKTNKNDYLEDQNQLFKSKMRGSHSQGMKFTPKKTAYSVSGSGHHNLNTNRSEYELKPIDTQGKLISTAAYQNCLKQFRKQKEKRSLLKQKDLLISIDGQIEIGCMSKRQGSTLHITFYITPAKQLTNLRYEIEGADRLSIQGFPNSIHRIDPKKQDKITLLIDVDRLPYELPYLTFFYQLNGYSEQSRIMVPCTFNRFIETKQISRQYIQNEFNLNKNNILRGQQIPYSKRILKDINQITDYIPHCTIFNGGSQNQNHEVVYGGKGKFQRQQFIFQVCIKPNQFLYFQGLGIASGGKGDQVLENFICLMSHLLMKEISWKS